MTISTIKLDILKDLSRIANTIEQTVIPDSYWDMEDELLNKRQLEIKANHDAVKMTDNKYHQQFNC